LLKMHRNRGKTGDRGDSATKRKLVVEGRAPNR